jgi:hypothetical protein
MPSEFIASVLAYELSRGSGSYVRSANLHQHGPIDVAAPVLEEVLSRNNLKCALRGYISTYELVV